MTQLVSELYDALRSVGVADDLAKAAARAVIAAEDKEQLVTKADLRAELAELKTEIIKWNLVAMGFLTAVFSGLVTLLKFKP